jgi:hypothetical protein
MFMPWDDYRLELSDLPEDVYVKAARFGTKDILGKSFPISGPTKDRFEVVLSPNGGRVEGTVVSPEGRPLSSATVVLVPEAGLRRIDLYRTATTDASGRYVLRGVAPGEYKAFAFENASDSWAAFEPGSRDLSNSGSVSVRVVENAWMTASIRINR